MWVADLGVGSWPLGPYSNSNIAYHPRASASWRSRLGQSDGYTTTCDLPVSSGSTTRIYAKRTQYHWSSRPVPSGMVSAITSSSPPSCFLFGSRRSVSSALLSAVINRVQRLRHSHFRFPRRTLGVVLISNTTTQTLRPRSRTVQARFPASTAARHRSTAFLRKLSASTQPIGCLSVCHHTHSSLAK